jgi:ATP-dependent DNA helicase
VCSKFLNRFAFAYVTPCAVYNTDSGTGEGAGKTKPTLIVAPTSTIKNWCREVQRFSPQLPVVEYHGSKQHRAELQTSLRGKALQPGTVLVTSYQLAINDRSFLSRLSWQCVVVDESHKLKSLASVLKRELMNIAGACETPSDPVTRILLTGTPLQNDLLELWSLCNFVMPRVFADPDSFKTVYGFMALETEAGKAAVLARQRRDSVISKLHSLLARYLLRRTKAQVALDIPCKVEAVVYCSLAPLQRQLSRAILDSRLREEIADMGWKHQPGIHGSLSGTNRPLQLRKVCQHPYLFAEPEDAFNATDERLVLASGKLRVLDKMLQQLRIDGHKVLIFSQFRTVLDILQDFLTLRGGTLKLPADGYIPRIDGEVDLDTRQDAIDRFNGEGKYDSKEAARHFVALLSTRAGGQGINLTAADTVIIFDSDWNPHSDSQAEDRAHRIGQERPVAVYRLITDRSMEVDLLRRANAKRALERIVLRDGHWKLLAVAPQQGSTKQRALTPKRGTKRQRASASPLPPSDSGSPSAAAGEFGALPEQLLRLWLREDVRDKHGREGGISDGELEALLHRPLAVAAGLKQAQRMHQRAQEATGDTPRPTSPGVSAASSTASSGDAQASPTKQHRGRRASGSKGGSKGAEHALVQLPASIPPEGDGYTFVAHSSAGLLSDLCD